MNPPLPEVPPPPRPAAGVREILRIVMENFIILAGCLIFGIACGFIAQQVIPRAYEARARFLVNELPYSNGQTKITPEAEQPLVHTLIESVTSQELRDEVARQVGAAPRQIAFAELDIPLSLSGPVPEANVRLASDDKSRIGEIVVTSQSPEFAAKVANAILDDLQFFNVVGGRLKNLRLGMELDKTTLDAIVNELVKASSESEKLKQENAEMDQHVKLGLPLRDFPSFAEDGTLNNLKTQLVLVDSEYSGLAATVTRGTRIIAKRAEKERLSSQLESHVRRLADALRAAYAIASTRHREIEADVKARRNRLAQMTEESARLADTLSNPAAMRAIAANPGDFPAGSAANVIITVDRAVPRHKPKRPKLWLNLLLGAVFGCGLGGGLTALRVLLDTRLQTARRIEERIGVPCLAMLPTLDPIRKTSEGFDRPRSPIGLGYLRSHLLRAFLETKTPQSVGFTPSRRGDDTSPTVATLGILLAQAGHRTLVIDLYRKKPRIASALGVQEADGLSRWLASNDALGDHIGYSVLPNLGVLGFGNARRELDDLLGQRPISMEMPELLAKWDFVLVASPAIRFDWTMMLSLPPDSPLIVAADYHTARTDDVIATLQRARSTRWKVEGIVLQNCPERVSGSKSL